MMLFDSDTDFPLKSLLLEIQKKSRNIRERIADNRGGALESEYRMDLLESQDFEQLHEKKQQNLFGKMEMFTSVCVILSFAVIPDLCFLLYELSLNSM